MTLLLYLTIYACIPFVLVASRRYALSRTSYCGIRFSYRGEGRTFATISGAAWVLAMIP